MIFVLYILIGGIATSMHYLVLIGLVEGMRVAPVPAATIGAAFGALIAYVGNRRYTFPDCAHSNRIAFPRFLLVAALGAILNGGMVWVGTEALVWHYLVTQVVATLLTLLFTYDFNRSWAFV